MNNKTVLLNLREQIINIDENILKLLYKRKKLIIKIAEEKIKIKKPIRDINREQNLLSHLTNLNKKYNLDIDYIHLIFQCIINNSVIIQNKILKKHIIKNDNKINKKIKISFLGPKGSYSNIAAWHYANKNFLEFIEISCSSFTDVLYSVEQSKSDIALLPIENNNSGSINDVYDLLQNTNLSLIGELLLPIDHCILANKKCDLKLIKTIYSHPQSFQQCSNFIKKFPFWKLEYTDSTAAAMQIISSLKNSSVAALGSERSGIFYNLKTLKKNLSNYKKNITRFIILSSMPIFVANNIPSKTTFMITTNQKTGSLVEVLLVFKKNNLNIIKIESRPTNDNHWEEVFYIDIYGNLFSNSMQKSLNQLYMKTKSLKILGCYPIDYILYTK